MKSFIAHSMIALSVQSQINNTGLVANFQFDSLDSHLLHTTTAGNYTTDLAIAVGNQSNYSAGELHICQQPLTPNKVGALNIPGDREQSFVDASSVLTAYSGTSTNKIGADLTIGMWVKLMPPTDASFHEGSDAALPANQKPYTLLHSHCYLTDANCFPRPSSGSSQLSATYIELTLNFENSTQMFTADYLKWGGENKMAVDSTATLATDVRIPADTWVYIFFQRIAGVSSLSYINHVDSATSAVANTQPSIRKLKQWSKSTVTPVTEPATSFYDLSVNTNGVGTFSTANNYKFYLFGTDKYSDVCKLSYRTGTFPAQITSLRFYDRALSSSEITSVSQGDWCEVAATTSKNTDSQTVLIAVIAAVVGCLVCIALAVLIWFCCKKRKEAKEGTTKGVSNVENTQYEPDTHTANSTTKINYQQMDSEADL